MTEPTTVHTNIMPTLAIQPRRPRRQRPKGWRARLARVLRRWADWLAPLRDAP